MDTDKAAPNTFTPRSCAGLLLGVAIIGTFVWSCHRMTAGDAPKSHTRVVSRADFPGTWPLSIDGGTLECHGHDITITSGGQVYYLVGTPRPHGGSGEKYTAIWAGTDLEPLIAAGEELC